MELLLVLVSTTVTLGYAERRASSQMTIGSSIIFDSFRFPYDCPLLCRRSSIYHRRDKVLRHIYSTDRPQLCNSRNKHFKIRWSRNRHYGNKIPSIFRNYAPTFRVAIIEAMYYAEWASRELWIPCEVSEQSVTYRPV